MAEDRDHMLLLPEGKRLMTLDEFDGLSGAAGHALQELVDLTKELACSPAFNTKDELTLLGLASMADRLLERWKDNRLERRQVLEALIHNQGAKPVLN